MNRITRSLLAVVAVLMPAIAVLGPAPQVMALEEFQAFTPISPVRVLDTRVGLGADPGPLGPNDTIRLQLSGVGDLPGRLTGVVINVTSTQSSAPSFITVWPSGQDRPLTSNINTEPGQDTPNLVVVGTGSEGSIDLFNRAGTTHLVVDVTAYMIGGNGVTAVAPSRLMDSRFGEGTDAEPFGPEETRSVQVAGFAGVPVGSAAVVLNVTSTQATAASFLTVWPGGADRPLASTLNTEPGQDTPNLAIVALGADGSVDIFNRIGTTHVIADVVGYVQPSSLVKTGTPTRFLDTREGTGTGGRRQPVGTDETIHLPVAGVGQVPSNASAVIVNVTSTESTAPSFVTTWPSGAPRPTASTLNTEVGQTTPNLAVVKIGDGGRISLFNRFGTTHLIVDVAGWYLPPSTRPIVDELDFFKGEGFRSTSDFGLSRASAWRWNAETRSLKASTTAGVFATGENFYSYARLRTSFQGRRQKAELSYDLDWWGTMTSFIGADSSAEVWVTLRVYEIIPTNSAGPAERGPVIWERELEHSGVGAGLQAVSVDQVIGDVQRTEVLPNLTIGGFYRVEAELWCKTRVVFSIGATSCDFRTGDRGVTVNDWTLTYEPTT